jgi:hypothetical protein
MYCAFGLCKEFQVDYVPGRHAILYALAKSVGWVWVLGGGTKEERKDAWNVERGTGEIKITITNHHVRQRQFSYGKHFCRCGSNPYIIIVVCSIVEGRMSCCTLQHMHTRVSLKLSRERDPLLLLYMQSTGVSFIDDHGMELTACDVHKQTPDPCSTLLHVVYCVQQFCPLYQTRHFSKLRP